MSYEAYRYIFIIGLALCCVMFLVSVVIFFVLNIPKIINDLSGRTAKKAIQGIREQNERTGNKSYQVSQVNRERGKLTDKISPSGRIVGKNPSSQLAYSVETAKIAADAGETSVITESNETSVLSPVISVGSSSADTYVLGQEETSSLQTEGAPVFVSGETAVLSENTPITESAASDNQVVSDFNIEFEITYIHTNELIDIGGV